MLLPWNSHDPHEIPMKVALGISFTHEMHRAK